jgi:hypothetical protein
MSRKIRESARQCAKRISFGVPRNAKRGTPPETQASFFPGEDWHEPVEGERDGYRIIEKDPGEEWIHVVTPGEIADRLSEMPAWTLEELDVVQLSNITKKKKRFPCYGLQWGTALYLYPVNEDLVEIYCVPPRPKLLIETKMYGGVWKTCESEKLWILEWSEKTIRDFYLNSVLIHELGHLVDDRNTSYDSRERYADWFAIEYGYLPTRTQKTIKNRLKRSRKRHHS